MKDNISRWIDGDLTAPEAEQTLRRVLVNDELRDEFTLYTTIGDAMRAGDIAATERRAKIFAALAEEPTVLAPSAAKAAATQLNTAREARAARSGVLDSPRFKMGFAAAASAATVAAVGWIGFQDRLTPAQVAATKAAPMASAPVAVLPVTNAVATPNAMPGVVQDYLAVHRQMPNAAVISVSHRADSHVR